MNQKNKIQKLQNTNDMLNCQYAARFYFNHAEIMGYLAFIISCFSALCIFLPDTNSMLIISLPIIIDIISFVIQFSFDCIQKKAARLRNYFDAVVLGINEKSFSPEDVKTIKESTLHAINKNPQKYQLQIHNTGSDTPPGVKNWYDLSFKENSKTNAVFECQKQNYIWTDKLSHKRLLITCGVIFCIVAICISSVCIFHLSPAKWIPCFFALAYNQLSNSFNAYKHYKIMQEIYTITQMPDVENNSIQIKYLQNKISELREIPILEINAIHKHCNKQWAEIYTKIIQK